MLRWVLSLIGIGIVAVVVAALAAPAFIPPADLPAAPVTPTPPALMVERDADEKDEAPPSLLPTLVDVRQSVQLSLAPAWQTTFVSANTADESLQQLSASDNKATRQAARTLMSGLSADAVLLTGAYQVDNNWADRVLLIYAVKRNSLSLERYLQDVEGQLTAQGVTIVGKTITADYRSDRLPVGVLHYRLPPTAGPLADGAVHGIQLATFDRSAERLIVFTITTTTAADLEMRALEILRGATF